MEQQPRILIIDDQEMNIELMRHFLGTKGYDVSGALGGEEGLRMVKELSPDAVILDLIMPEMNGYEVCQLIKLNPKTQHIPVIILTGAAETEANVRALEVGADDFLQRPFNAALLDARIRNCIRSKRLQDTLVEYRHRLEEYNEKLERRVLEQTQKLEKTQHAIVFALAKLAESRDPETGEHLERIRLYAKELTEELAKRDEFKHLITREYVELIYNASPLHDIGKVGIPDRILLKPGKLTKEEFDIMKAHTGIGASTLLAAEKEAGGSPLLTMAKDIAYYHHERWDGNGYPEGIKGNDIPLSSRIVSIADCYDALVSKRTYKAAFSHEKARTIIVEEGGTHFDPMLVEAFLAREEAFEKIHEGHKDSGSVSLLEMFNERLEEKTPNE